MSEKRWKIKKIGLVTCIFVVVAGLGCIYWFFAIFPRGGRRLSVFKNVIYTGLWLKKVIFFIVVNNKKTFCLNKKINFGGFEGFYLQVTFTNNKGCGFYECNKTNVCF